MDDPQTSPQIIKTPAGDDLVVLPRQDYDALLEALAEAQEELADIATLDRRLAEIAREAVPPFPPEVNRLIYERHRRPAAIRLWRRLSVEEVAARSGLSSADIAAFEAGDRMHTSEEARQLAAALDVHIAWLEP